MSEEKSDESQQQQEPQLTEEQKELLAEAMQALGDAIDSLEKSGRVSRPISLALTRAEESDMWLQRGLEDLGYKAQYADDDEDDADDDGEQDESE